MKVEDLITLLRTCSPIAEVRVAVDDHSFGLVRSADHSSAGCVNLLVDEEDDNVYP